MVGGGPTPNKVDVKLSPDGKIEVYNFNGSVNVILDVVGYYTNSSVSSSRPATGTYEVESNRNITTRAATATPADANSDGVVPAREVTLNQLSVDPTSSSCGP